MSHIKGKTTTDLLDFNTELFGRINFDMPYNPFLNSISLAKDAVEKLTEKHALQNVYT
jgi:hypothetical protein